MHTPADVEPFTSIMTGPRLRGAIVVATDGTHDSDGAVRVGVALGFQHGVRVEMISVVEVSDFGEFEGDAPADIERATHFAIVSRGGELTAQRQRAGVMDGTLLSTIKVGCRVAEIVRFAEQLDAALIVAGLGSQGVLARLLNRHTVTRLAAAASIPVLAVPCNGLPLGDGRLSCISLPPTHVH